MNNQARREELESKLRFEGKSLTPSEVAELYAQEAPDLQLTISNLLTARRETRPRGNLLEFHPR